MTDYHRTNDLIVNDPAEKSKLEYQKKNISEKNQFIHLSYFVLLKTNRIHLLIYKIIKS